MFPNILNFLSDIFKKTEKKQYGDVIVINEEGKILVLLRSNSDSFEPGKWTLPGGHIESNEDFKAGSKRELLEETNINIELDDLEFYKTIEKDDCILNYFVCSVDTSDLDIILDAKEHQGYEWITTNEILDKDFLLDLKEFLIQSFDVKVIEKDNVDHFNNIEFLTHEEQIEKSFDVLDEAFDNDLIDEGVYFEKLKKLNLIKSNYESQFEERVSSESGDVFKIRICDNIQKSDDLKEEYTNQYTDYVENGFFYDGKIYDTNGLGLPLTPQEVEQLVASTPTIHKIDKNKLESFQLGRGILEGTDSYNFKEILPEVEKYNKLYNKYEEELKEQFASSQTNFKQRKNEIKNTLKEYFSKPITKEEYKNVFRYVKSELKDNIDPLLTLSIYQDDGDTIKKQIHLSELKAFIESKEEGLLPNIIKVEIVDFDDYGATEFKIDYFDKDSQSNISVIHNLAKSKILKNLEFKNQVTKSFDGGEINEDEFLEALFKSDLNVIEKGKRYEFVKVLRDGKIFYQNRLVGSDKFEEMEVGGSFSDEQTGLEVKQYSDKSLLISGNTYKNIDLLRSIKEKIGYGTWNKALNGWIFPSFAKDKIFNELAQKMKVDTYEETIDKENALAIKNAVNVGTKVLVDGVESVVNGISATNGKVEYEVQPIGEPNVENIEKELSDNKRGRKEVPIGTLSKDGKFIKTEKGWEYIKKKKKEKDIGLLPADENKFTELINNANEENRFQTDKELFGKAEGEQSVAEEIEKNNTKFVVESKNFTTRSGEVVNALDYSNYPQRNIQLVEQSDILDKEKPDWCPVINEMTFFGSQDDIFLFNYTKLDNEKVLLALNGYERGFGGKDISDSVKNEELKQFLINNRGNFTYSELRRADSMSWFNSSEGSGAIVIGDNSFTYNDREAFRYDKERILNNQESQYAVVTLDQLVAMQDYYTKYRKADIQNDKDKNIQKRLESIKDWDDKKLDYYYPFDYKKRLSDKQKKKWTEEEWNSLSKEEKIQEIPNMKHPVISLPTAKRIKQLSDDRMLTADFKMYKKFVNKDYNIPVRTYTEFDEAAIEYKEIREFIQWRRNDLNIQREENSSSYTKGIETSWGDSNTKDDLLDTLGVKVKSQNGKEIKADQIEDIEKALKDIYKSFGDRSSLAKKHNLKISHSGEKMMFASKALGMYVPSMNAIGVSNNKEHDKFGFTLAHEIGHFIDNKIGEKTGRNYASDNYNSTAGKIAIEFRRLMKKGEGNSDYHCRTAECFARAAEQYFAMNSEGENAIKSKKIGIPYHESDWHVNKKDFVDKIKPLIEQFFKENDELLKSIFEDNDIEKSNLNEVETISSEIESNLKGCLMLFPNIDLNIWVQKLQTLIPHDIVIEYEEEPHLTLLYGFLDNRIDKTKLYDFVNKYLENNSIEFNLKPISLFENEERDVVKIGVEDLNGNLTKLNQLLKDNFEYENDYPDYSPHITLAYVKAGHGKQFEGVQINIDDWGLKDEGFYVNYFDKDKVHTFVYLQEQDIQKGKLYENILVHNPKGVDYYRRQLVNADFEKKDNVKRTLIPDNTDYFEKQIDTVFEYSASESATNYLNDKLGLEEEYKNNIGDNYQLGKRSIQNLLSKLNSKVNIYSLTSLLKCCGGLLLGTKLYDISKLNIFNDSSVEFNILTNKYSLYRRVDFDNLEIIENDTFKNISKEALIGTSILKNQVDFASKAGFKQLKTTALRTQTQNGYYTWLMLGYIPVKNSGFEEKLKEITANTPFEGKTYLNLLSSKNGRSLWKERGFGFEGVFDLDENSLSRKIFDKYLESRNIK